MAQQKYFQAQTCTEGLNALCCYTQPPYVITALCLPTDSELKIPHTPQIRTGFYFLLNSCSWYRRKCCDEPHEIPLACTSQDRRLQHYQQKNPTKSMACTDQDKFDYVMMPSVLYPFSFLHLMLGVSTVGMDLSRDLFCQSLHLKGI